MLRRTFLAAPMLAAAARTPQKMAEELAAVYGQEISDLVYTQTVALIGRLRLGQREEVVRILEPWLSGAKDGLAKPTASHYSGHLVFAHLEDPRAKRLLIKAADMASNDPLDSEMSDSVFMVCPLLVAAGKQTGQSHYYDTALEHLRKMEKLCLRTDGLYRHSPLAEVAWGRGNAFPALGLALSMGQVPAMRPHFVALMRVLAKYQEAGGMWRQVIDERDAWLEYSCTAMIGTAMQHGITTKVLPADVFRPHVERAWAAIESRTGADGSVTDVCESTGKMKSLNDYLTRKAIRGKDARGGAMGLLFATEVSGETSVAKR